MTLLDTTEKMRRDRVLIESLIEDPSLLGPDFQPIKSLTDDSDDIWQQRLITTGLGLLLYGGLMLLIANYLPKKRARRVSSVYEIPPDFRKH